MPLGYNGFTQEVESGAALVVGRNGFVQPVESPAGGGIITGGGVAGQVAYFTGAQVVAGDTGFLWDSVNQRATIGLAWIYTPGTQNLFIGETVGNLTLTGAQNTAVGYQAFQSNTTGAHNASLGNSALDKNTTGSFNTAMGVAALTLNTTGSHNTGFADSALYHVLTGSRNSAFGFQSLFENLVDENSAFGYRALAANVSGAQVSAFGSFALVSSTAANNSAFGYSASFSNTSGGTNSSFGSNALYSNVSGSDNCAFGFQTLFATTGTGSSAFGRNALVNATGDHNTALGFVAGSTTVAGARNTFLGASTDASAAGLNNAVAIGYGAVVGASSSVAIGGTGGNAVSVGIQQAIPRRRLDVLDTAAAQIRLTYTDNSVYADLLADSAGLLNITTTGNAVFLVNGATAQVLRVYGTTTGNKYARVAHDGTDSYFASSAGNCYVGTDSSAVCVLFTNGTARWYVDASGHFVANADNTYDFGASGATRCRTGYFGTSIVVGTGVTIASTSVTINAGSIITDTGTGLKIGTATNQKIGFFNANPVVQGASVADAAGGTIIDVEARAAVNALISRIEATGLIATV